MFLSIYVLQYLCSLVVMFSSTYVPLRLIIKVMKDFWLLLQMFFIQIQKILSSSADIVLGKISTVKPSGEHGFTEKHRDDSLISQHKMI